MSALLVPVGNAIYPPSDPDPPTGAPFEEVSRYMLDIVVVLARRAVAKAPPILELHPVLQCSSMIRFPGRFGFSVSLVMVGPLN
jgi:hypothetical protein